MVAPFVVCLYLCANLQSLFVICKYLRVNLQIITYGGGNLRFVNMKRVDEAMPYGNKKVLELVEGQADGNVSVFAKMIGKSQQSVNRLLNVDPRSGKYPRLSEEMLEVICRRFRIAPAHFYESSSGEEQEDEKEGMLPHIPSKAAAGGLGGFSDTVTQNTCEFRPVIKMIPKYDMTIDVKGDSMLPKYQNGDIVAIRRVVDVIEWGSVYVLDTADGAVLKRLYDEEECFRCVSYNPEYHDFLVNKQNVYGVYKVVGLIRI